MSNREPNHSDKRSEETMDATTTPQGGGSAAQGTRRLQRRRHDRVIAGVAGGLGDYFGIDPVIVRLVFVAATIAGGTGIIAYFAAWLLVPEAPAVGQPPSAPKATADRPQTWVGVALLVVGASMLFGQFGWWGPEVLWGLALIGIGVLVFRNDQERRSAPPPPPAPPEEEGSSSAAAWPDPQPEAVAPAPRPPRERSILGWLTAGTALVAVGIASLLSEAGTISLAGYQILALGLGVVGVGLVVGGWLGRSRALIAVGVLLVPAVLVASLLRVSPSVGSGERLFAPRTAAQLLPAYELFAGEMTLDLSRLPLDRPTRVRAEVGAGSIEVRVPEETSTRVHAAVDIGEVSIFGAREEGADLDVTRLRGTGDGLLDLDLSSSVGEIVVVTVPSTGPAPPTPAAKNSPQPTNDKGRTR
jgi:phage shock protein PspC (stress-responsive transcriptional regulator)